MVRLMADLVVIVPSRGRPQAARELAQAFASTCTADTRLVFAVDEDDPLLPEYSDIPRSWADSRRPAVEMCVCDATGSMVGALNGTAKALAEVYQPAPFALGFLGDDHRPRTRGWDARYLEALRELGTGIVYGDDLLQSERLPTQCAMTADIVRALGFMAPPSLGHLFVDNFWRDLGHAAGCLRYLPDVVVEHLHPAAGKATVDEGYARVNAGEQYARDGEAYAKYRAGYLASDVAMVRQLRIAAGLRDGQLTVEPERHEWRMFEQGTVPEYTRPEWYATREHAPHLEQEGHRDRLMATATLVARVAWSHKLSTVVDLGAGDGGLLSLLGPKLRTWGYDLQPSNLEAAKDRNVDVRYGDVVDGDVEWGEIAVCTEMLEHLVDPHAFVRRIAQNAQALVCSSPWLERPGSAYEFHAWCWDLDGYRTLVEQAGLKVLRQQHVHGFQLILAVRP